MMASWLGRYISLLGYEGASQLIVVKTTNKASDSDTVNPPSIFSPQPKETRLLDGGLKKEAPFMARARRPIIDAHKHLFGLLYHVPLPISNSDFVEAKQRLETLMTVADMYGCLTIAEFQVNNHLLHFKCNEYLLKLCCKNTQVMLQFATKVRSAWIFKETLVHAINNLEMYQGVKWADHGYIYLLVAKKRRQLLAMMKDVNHATLLHAGHPGPNETPAQILARAYFRDWFVRKITKYESSPLQWGYAKVYRRIHLGKLPQAKKVEAFLSRTGNIFSAPFADFSRAVSGCFTSAASRLSGLMVNTHGVSELVYPDTDRFKRPLTCVEITDLELPWAVKRAASMLTQSQYRQSYIDYLMSSTSLQRDVPSHHPS